VEKEVVQVQRIACSTLPPSLSCVTVGKQILQPLLCGMFAPTHPRASHLQKQAELRRDKSPEP